MTPAWNLAREMGASRTYNFTRYADLNLSLIHISEPMRP